MGVFDLPGPVADQLALGLIAGGRFVRRVAEPSVKRHAPRGPHQPEDEERLPPAEPGGQRPEGHERHGAAQAGGHPDRPLGRAALAEREPAVDHARDVRVGPRLRAAEQEANRHEDDQHGRRAAGQVEARRPAGEEIGRPGQGGEQRPEHDEDRQHAPRPPAIAHPAGGDLEKHVADGEGAENIAHQLVGDAQLELDVPLALRNANAVEVGEQRQGADEGEDAEAGARGFRIGTAGGESAHAWHPMDNETEQRPLAKVC